VPAGGTRMLGMVMETRGLRRGWRPASLSVVVGCLLLLLTGTAGVTAQDAGGARWQSSQMPQSSASRIHLSPSGVLFASGGYAGLVRSNDGGQTWRSIPLVAGPSKRSTPDVPDVAVAIDPVDHAVAYYGGRDGLFQTTNGGLGWRKLTPVSGNILSITVSPADARLIFVVVDAPGRVLQFWRSRDGGETWAQTPEPVRSDGRTCLWRAPILYPHPLDAATVFLQAICGSGISWGRTPLLVSADQGDTWQTSHEQPRSFAGHLVGGHGTDPNRFYLLAENVDADGGYAVLRSDDGARTWTTPTSVPTTTPAEGLSYGSASALTYDPEAPNRVYAGVRFSDDAGTTWRTATLEGLRGEVRDLALSLDRRRLYAATSDGVHWLPLKEDGAPPTMGEAAASTGDPRPSSSSDLQAGSAWETTAQTAAFERLVSFAGRALFALTGDGTLYRTEDEAATWARVDAPTKLHSMVVAIDPTDPTTLYVEGNDGVYKTTNNARTWQQIPVPIEKNRDSLHGISVSPADRNLVYVSAGSGPSRLLRSRDGCQTWETAQESAPGPGGSAARCAWWTHVLEPHPTDANRVFASTGCTTGDGGPRSGLRHTTDQGQTWSDVFDDPTSFPTALVGGRGVASERFYLLAGNRLLRSDDDGYTWAEILVNGITSVAFDLSSPDRLFVGLGTSGVYTSADGGATWMDLGAVGENLQVRDLALGADGRTLYAATNRGIWRLRTAE
jgi:photosystem II stability/assembly factor-like uncharacterized protein